MAGGPILPSSVYPGGDQATANKASIPHRLLAAGWFAIA